ncbi:MAG TPA: zf-HC2 domain-containing protein [Gemmatimonadaceae bacterium]|nr:zf-HC2 domain-containing protein [Gemmatimonadaceae bacterium]
MRDLLPLFAAGRLADADRARVESHVAGCAACAAELGLVRRVSRAYEVRPVDTAAIVARLPARATTRRVVPFHRQPLWRVAASLTLMIGAAAVLTVARSRSGVSTMTGVQPAPVVPGTATVAPDTDARQLAATADPHRAIGLGVSLTELTDAQLESLLNALDKMDGRVLPDPERMSRSLVPSGTDPEQGRN